MRCVLHPLPACVCLAAYEWRVSTSMEQRGGALRKLGDGIILLSEHSDYPGTWYDTKAAASHLTGYKASMHHNDAISGWPCDMPAGALVVT